MPDAPSGPARTITGFAARAHGAHPDLSITPLRSDAMAKAAIVILGGTESHADDGRDVNGLEAAKEFAENPDDDLELTFEGAGTQ